MDKKTLFEFIFEDGRHIKIFNDGTYEGLPSNTVIINKLHPIIHQIVSNIRINFGEVE